MKFSKMTPLAVALAAGLLVGCQKREQVPPTSEPPAGSTASAPTTGAAGTMGETPSNTPPATMPPATSASPPGETAPAASPPASGASTTGSLDTRGGVAGTGTEGGLSGSGTVAGAGTMAQPGQDLAAGAVSAGPLNTADKTFVAKAAGGGLYEVEVAKLAVDKATDPAVKSFATMLVEQHSAANAELKALAAMRDVKLPDAVPADKKEAIDKLAKKSGASFDQAFVKEVGLKDHEEDIKLFESASQDTKDQQLKAWIDKTLPTLKSHLAAAQKLPGAS